MEWIAALSIAVVPGKSLRPTGGIVGEHTRTRGGKPRHAVRQNGGLTCNYELPLVEGLSHDRSVAARIQNGSTRLEGSFPGADPDHHVIFLRIQRPGVDSSDFEIRNVAHQEEKVPSIGKKYGPTVT